MSKPHTSYLPDSVKHIADTRLTNRRQYLRDMPELPEDAPLDPDIEAKTRPGVEWRNLPDRKRRKGV